MNTAVKELHLLDALQARLKPEPMNDLQITRDDMGKVFVLKKGERTGELVTREAFATIPVFEIQAWVVVNEFDVNTWN